ncbi:MAG: terpene utilization protein AtuA [Betaproteobacteria bacterium SG8_39]|nr:MAG: terpene utilization protein AtuA [Betaproteobacteria bacterium SG8_39]
MGSKTIRIGCAAGFWGDSSVGAPQLVRHGHIDFLVFDYLAELTMSILARAKQKDPGLGYATDFPAIVMRSVVREIAEQGIRVISNAGGLNPAACAAAVAQVAEAAGVKLSIAVVSGDDLMPQVEALRARGVRDLWSGAALPARVVSANAYLGAFPIAQALDRGAQVVITGRCVDSAVELGPLIHAFGWAPTDYDRLAAGSLAGHLLECGAQATGGLHTDWERVPDWANIGYPIAECAADGSFVITKPEGTGGLVTPATVGEQMLYEIHDPGRYLLPDVVCDFTDVRMTQAGEHRVAVQGARGAAPTPDYKVAATYADGWRLSAQLTLIGIDAARKARRTGEAILERSRAIFQSRGLADYRRTRIEALGAESAYGPHSRAQQAREVVMRLVAEHQAREPLEILAREIAPAGTSWSPGTTGSGLGRQSPVPVVKLFSCLVPKAEVAVSVAVDGAVQPWAPAPVTASGPERTAPRRYTEFAPLGGTRVEVPLIKLAWARSGDKGDTENIGVLARHADFLPVIGQAVTARRVADYFAYCVDGPVTRYDVPGIQAFNFVLENALDGGGIASLRADPLGKGFAQMLLDLPVAVPQALAERHRLLDA